MMNCVWLDLVQQHRAIAVIRTSELSLGYEMARAVAAAGMQLIEITWNSDRPTLLIEKLRATLPHCTIGAGTLISQGQVQEAIAAGAEFLFTPHVDIGLVDTAIQQEVPMIPGALSPTEIVNAWQAGAASVKVFPVQALGGVDYIKRLQGPLGNIPLIPTGGITPDNARAFIDAGAIAVGLSGQLFPQSAIANQDWQHITQHAQTLMQRLNMAQPKG